EVFKRFGIDFCCGGKDQLDRICNKKGINLAEVKQALKALDEQQLQQHEITKRYLPNGPHWL
ncbi:unnamed protein product, partial [marine sediment metagenome]